MDPAWIMGAMKLALFASFLLIGLTIWGRLTHTLHLVIPIFGWLLALVAFWLGVQMKDLDVYVAFANFIRRNDVSDAVIWLATIEVVLVFLIWLMVVFAFTDIIKGLIKRKIEHEKQGHPL